MKQFTSLYDVPNVPELVNDVIKIKGTQDLSIGKGKTLGLVFFNSSLRTRMSTQKAAYNLGMNVMVLNANEGWNMEFEDGAVMNGNSQEHIKDAIRVMSGYCDIIGVRSFPELKSREDDYAEKVLSMFIKYSKVPVVSLESATLHPLQSLADMATIQESGIANPKIVITWAPHPRKLPQAVPNSFLQWASALHSNVVLAHPKGYELKEEFTKGVTVTNNQEEALKDADFVYTKNWSSYTNYGETPAVEEDWMITAEKMKLTNHGKFMHCLPLRRNVIATDEVVDNSIIYEQADNRLWSAQTVLHHLLKTHYGA